jgi:hypothetical protein
MSCRFAVLAAAFYRLAEASCRGMLTVEAAGAFLVTI